MFNLPVIPEQQLVEGKIIGWCFLGKRIAAISPLNEYKALEGDNIVY